MNAEANLQEAYQQWRKLAESEGEAIRVGDWARVNVCQGALRELQPQIIRFTAEAQKEWASTGADRTAKEDNFRTMIKSLIELEMRNNTWLQDRRQTVSAEMNQLNQSEFTLHRVQRRYAPSKLSGWQSFS